MLVKQIQKYESKKLGQPQVKLISDLLSIKNQAIEKMKQDIQNLSQKGLENKIVQQSREMVEEFEQKDFACDYLLAISQKNEDLCFSRNAENLENLIRDLLSSQFLDYDRMDIQNEFTLVFCE